MNTAAITEMPAAMAAESEWLDVCAVTDLAPNTGVCALIKGQQVAVFHAQRLATVFALGNYDPIGKANVLSRGMIGSIGDTAVVASPLYKQHFDLRTGQCLESPEHRVPAYPVRIHSDRVQVHLFG